MNFHVLLCIYVRLVKQLRHQNTNPIFCYKQQTTFSWNISSLSSSTNESNCLVTIRQSSTNASIYSTDKLSALVNGYPQQKGMVSVRNFWGTVFLKSTNLQIFLCHTSTNVISDRWGVQITCVKSTSEFISSFKAHLWMLNVDCSN